jgi:ADP-ribose pyrophosphatase YjhB (NUDIX family)
MVLLSKRLLVRAESYSKTWDDHRCSEAVLAHFEKVDDVSNAEGLGEHELGTAVDEAWLDDHELEIVRGRVPMVYVEAVPVRLDEVGRVTHVGLLLRAMADATISRAIVSGRVLWGETVREALQRHLDKDLGPSAFPRVPAAPAPFTVVEYMPDRARTGYHDPRQHAVSLAYLVPVEGECHPSQEALDFVWISSEEAASAAVSAEMTGGQDRIVRLALAHAGQLP